jgi:tRNA dimethylallyltransferase
MAKESEIHLPSSILHLRAIFLAGSTAVGKSEIALALAEKVGGEIISVDSMQVYRRLDIGTAKPSVEERKQVPHHLIDVVDLTESFDAAKFISFARKAEQEIQSRGRVPIFCGGTGLYFKAYLEGLGEAPPSDPKLRAELEAIPLDELLRELKERDAMAYEKIDRQNPRRVIRAVEVIRLTGKPFSAQQADWKAGSSRCDDRTAQRTVPTCFGFKRSNSDLHERINLRVDKMFRDGLVAETEALLKRGLAENKTAMQSLGYRQVVEHLRGERSLEETIELVKIRTRQFAKRQMTWFRRQMKLEWIDSSAQTAAATAEQLANGCSIG